MRVFSITGFPGMYPVGTAAIVVAKDERHALELLSMELADKGLGTVTVDDKKNGMKVELVHTHEPKAIILCDGDY